MVKLTQPLFKIDVGEITFGDKYFMKSRIVKQSKVGRIG